MGGNLGEVLQWDVCSVSCTSVEFVRHLLRVRPRLPLGVNCNLRTQGPQPGAGTRTGPKCREFLILSLPLVFHSPNVYWHQICARPWDAEQMQQSLSSSPSWVEETDMVPWMCRGRDTSDSSHLQMGVTAAQPLCGRKMGAAKILGRPALPTGHARDTRHAQVSDYYSEIPCVCQSVLSPTES